MQTRVKKTPNNEKKKNTPHLYPPSFSFHTKLHTHSHTQTHSNLTRPSLIGHLSSARLHLAPVEHSLTFQTADLSSLATAK